MTPSPMSRPADTETPSRPGLDPRMRRILGAVAATGAVLSLGALAFFGASIAFSVAVGAAIAASNLWVLARVIGALLPADDGAARAQSRSAWGLVAILKLFGLVAVVWLLMRHGVVSTLPMLVGFGSLPIGIALGTLVSDRGRP
jgi:hypothetical protein